MAAVTTCESALLLFCRSRCRRRRRCLSSLIKLDTNLVYGLLPLIMITCCENIRYTTRFTLCFTRQRVFYDGKAHNVDWQQRKLGLSISKIQLVVYYQYRVLIC